MALTMLVDSDVIEPRVHLSSEARNLGSSGLSELPELPDHRAGAYGQIMSLLEVT